MSEEKQLPDTVAKFLKSDKSFHTKESTEKGLLYNPGPTDVIISTAIKSGTALTQQICHGLRSGGDMSFEEIDLMIPSLEMGHDYGYKDLYAPQPYQPQMFKTHFWYQDTPKGAGKYIVVVRKPADTALSLYHFFGNWFFEKSKISIEDFVEQVWLQLGSPESPKHKWSPAHHIMSWYPHRLDKNVLWLHYEDINQNRCECVRLIAEFLEIEADEALLDLVTKQSSVEFMKKHPNKFDVHLLKYARNEAAGLPRDAGMTGNLGKVRKGEIDGAKEVIPRYIMDKVDAQWNEVVTSVTGYKTYEDLRNGINKELSRNLE